MPKKVTLENRINRSTWTRAWLQSILYLRRTWYRLIITYLIIRVCTL